MTDREIVARLYNEKDADIFADFEKVRDCTNKAFFENKLDPVVFSFTRNPRSKCAFLPDRYASVEGKIRHGFALNSSHCKSVGDEGSMLLIASLLVQQARRDLGPEGRNGTRGTPGNIDSWSHKVFVSIGIETFVPDGDEERQLGYGLSYKPIEGGPFDLMCRSLMISGFRFRWHENAPNLDTEANDSENAAPPEPKPQTRAKFECPECGLKALAKPGARLVCGSCNLAMPPAAENFK